MAFATGVVATLHKHLVHLARLFFTQGVVAIIILMVYVVFARLRMEVQFFLSPGQRPGFESCICPESLIFAYIHLGMIYTYDVHADF